MTQQITPAINITDQPTSTSVNNNINSNPQIGVKQEWSTGLFDCFSDCGECIFALFCHYCHIVHLFTKANEGCCSCLFGGLVPLRTKIRTERGIRGTIFNDACLLCWCEFCATLQMSREIKNTKPLV